ncbi:MAG: IS701 family transposase [Streptomyces sp.]
MTTNQDSVAVRATLAHALWGEFFDGLMGRVAGCFPRRETRLTCRNMVQGLLIVKDSANCWSVAEAIGHTGPQVLQHFLSRARFDTEAIRRAAAAWTVEQLGSRDVMLVVDETGDENSSTDAVGAARQYSGALGGIGLCQVAVHLSYVSADGHALIDRHLYLGADWAADDERRILAGVPDETVFATKPQLAGDMLEAAHNSGVRTGWVAADEVYGGRELRARIRTLGYGCAIAVPAGHHVTTPGGGKTKATTLLERVPKRAWMRLRTVHVTEGERLYDWAMIDVNADDTPPGHPARTPWRAQPRPDPAPPPHRRPLLLPHLAPRPETDIRAGQRGLPSLARRGGLPAGQGPGPPRHRPGHLLDILAPLEPDEHARPHPPSPSGPSTSGNATGSNSPTSWPWCPSVRVNSSPCSGCSPCPGPTRTPTRRMPCAGHTGAADTSIEQPTATAAGTT